MRIKDRTRETAEIEPKVACKAQRDIDYHRHLEGRYSIKTKGGGSGNLYPWNHFWTRPYSLSVGGEALALQNSTIVRTQAKHACFALHAGY